MNNRIFQKQRLIGCLWIGVALTVCAEASSSERLTVARTDASRPVRVEVDVLNGSISVKGYQGDDVVVEAEPQRLKVKESDNQVTVLPDDNRPVDVRLTVPAGCSLKLKCTSGGNITVERVEGEIEVEGVNASITLRKITGTVVAHSVQGRIMVQMDHVAADKPMSFSTMNGDIDVSLPADTTANVTLQTLNGRIHSDFAIVPTPDSRQKAGQRLVGVINGGGPQIHLKTLNGGIYLRKSEQNEP